MSKNLMIKNLSGYDLKDIMEYLVGYTTKLMDKIDVHTECGAYYDTVVVHDMTKVPSGCGVVVGSKGVVDFTRVPPDEV